MSSSSSDEDAYGPALPPHLLKQKAEDKTKSLAVIGPSLPPGFKSSTSTSSSKMTQHDEEPDEKVDPLPRKQRPRPVLIGPRPPASTSTTHHKHEHASNEIEDDDQPDEEDANDDDNNDDDDDVDIGPFPPDHPKSQARYNLSMARSGAESSSSASKGKPKREEWMLIPPKNKPISNLALAPRKFLTRSLDNSTASDAIHRRDSDSDEDDSSNLAEENDMVKQEFQAQLIEKRDELMSNLLAQSESGTSGRSGAESLLESHRKKLKKKRKLQEEEAKANKSSSSKVERRAFDRDTDLQVSRMSADDKKRFINRATSELQGRFSHSRKTGKFL